MSTVAQIKRELLNLQDTYVPLGETADHIKDISIAMIIGATCVGKSTIIKTVTELDPDFSNPGGFTTRELRPTDAKSYRQLDNKPESLAGFLEQVKRGGPVQYNVYDTGHIYGSEVRDYTTPFSVLDTQYSAVKNLARAGFESTHPIAIVTPPEQYVSQLKDRFGPNPDKDDMKIRLAEGEKSLVFCLEQEDDVAWVINRSGDAKAAAFEVIGLTRAYRRESTGGRLIGERLLNKIRQLND